jgi:RNA polymerase sigma-70 factor (ECF subfamily)
MYDQLTPCDEELVRAAQEGLLEAFSTLYERYLPRVFKRVCCVIPEQDVEDVTQEVFIAVMKSLPSFRYESRFSTWLRTLVNRQVADYYRKRNSQEILLGDVSGTDPDRFLMLGRKDHEKGWDELIILSRALGKLPEHYQEIILLRFVEGMQFNEIAEERDQTLEATKSLYRRAIAALSQEVTIGD